MDLSKYQVTKKNLLIKRKEVKTKTEGGIYIPEASANKPLEGTVVLKGSDVTLSVVPGDAVIFDRFAGAEMPLEDKTFLIMDEDDILIIVKK